MNNLIPIIPSAINIYPLKTPLNPPVNTVAPSISGTAQNGSTLTETNGTYTGATPITFTYQWKRDGSTIVGATNQTYVLTQSDVGHSIKCTETATNSAGSIATDSNSVSVTSTLINNLISYWKLDESSAGVAPVTRVDSVIASANNLTDTNNTPSGTGIIGNGASVSVAKTDNLTHVSNSSLQTGDIDFTYSCWINVSSLTSAQQVFAIKGSANIGIASTLEWGIELNALNQPLFRVSNGSALTDITGSAVSTGIWYHIVVWHDSVNNTVNMKVNNGGLITSSYSLGVVATSGGFRICGDGAGRNINAVVDECGFWKRVLTNAEITELYNAGVGVTYPNF